MSECFDLERGNRLAGLNLKRNRVDIFRRLLAGRDEVQWVASPYQDEWFKEDGVLKRPLQMAQGSLVTEACEIDETKFEVKRIAQVETKPKGK